MPRTDIAVQELVDVTTDAGSLITFTASDVVNGNAARFKPGRKLFVITKSTVAAGRNMSIKSAPAPVTLRFNDLDQALSGTLNNLAFFGPFPEDGWRQSDGKLWFNLDVNDVHVAVVAL